MRRTSLSRSASGRWVMQPFNSVDEALEFLRGVQGRCTVLIRHASGTLVMLCGLDWTKAYGPVRVLSEVRHG